MRFLTWRKDGGPLSKSWGFFAIEIKSLFSIVLLKFEPGSRDAYHTHAFGACSWLLKGKLVEDVRQTDRNLARTNEYTPSFSPILTPRHCFHKVVSVGTSYALTFRGPWKNRWSEYLPASNEFVTLSHGRTIESSIPAL
jgi:hypothetical protein